MWKPFSCLRDMGQPVGRDLPPLYDCVSIRRFAEAATHRLVLRRRLPAPFADLRLYVSSEGGLRYLRPSLSRVDDVVLRTVTNFVQPGHHVWDIGANLGLFALPAAYRSGPTGAVLAVEADPWLIRLLDKSARANPNVAPVTVVCVAASDTPGVARFNIARRSRSTNFLDGYGTTQTGGTRTSLMVPTLTLDALADCFPLPDVLKIDVEGAEVKVLEGATRVLASRPTLSLEVSSESSPRVHDILRPLGYHYLDADRAFTEVEMPVDQTIAVAQR